MTRPPRDAEPTTPPRTTPPPPQDTAPSLQDTNPPPQDGPSPQDTAPSLQDAAGPSAQDTGPSAQDTGPSLQDAAGPSAQDTGPSAQDTGPSLQDGTSLQDTGPLAQGVGPSTQGVGLSLQDVGLAVKRLQWRHHRTANERLAELGVSLVQWDVLRHLKQRPDASLHALAELTFQTDQSMGSLAARMVTRGLIERVPGPGRAIRHRLTDRGEDVREAGAKILDGVLAESLGKLSPAELAELHRLLLRAAT